MGSTWCPRCGQDLLAPSAYSSAWRCPDDGQVLPLSIFQRFDISAIEHVRRHAEVPLWIPDPAPTGWSLSGLGVVGDARSRLRGTVTACRGPAPLGGEGEWLIVAEEPGIGLGAGYAGYAGAADAAPPTADSVPPGARIHTSGHPTPLWPVPASLPDRSVYVGEAEGVWIWLISFPADAGYALLEDVALADARDRLPAPMTDSQRTDRLRPGPAR
ncbi:MAG TPA: DUF6758 family protein [Jatrophihabitans sp.]